MSIKRVLTGASIAVTLVTLSACGGGGDAATDGPGSEVLSNGRTVAEQIALRQDQYEQIGGAFKTIRDELEASSPDIATIQTAAANLPELGTGMGDWFPQGTGPESGVETEALPTIWETPEDFAQKVADFQAAAASIDTAAQSGDLAAIAAAVQPFGGTCKACHDNYRLDD